MAGMLSKSWLLCGTAPLDTARNCPRLLVFASKPSSDSQSNNGGGTLSNNGVGSLADAPPRRVPRTRRRSLKKSKGMAALQASVVTKGSNGRAVCEDGGLSVATRTNGAGRGPAASESDLKPVRILLRRDPETGNGTFRSLTIPDDEGTVELDPPDFVNEDVSPPLANDPNDICILPKPIFVISDCTGESAANTVRAALGQFENCFKTSVPANLLVFRFLSDEKKLIDIVERAKTEGALVVFTLAEPNMVNIVRTACSALDVKFVDLWSNLLENMEGHLDAVRSGLPLGSPERQQRLSEDYFKMIEAVEFTRKMDDGAHPHKWHQADLLLLGVSRSGKTPLSIYLGQRGYKVANLPLVRGLPLPKQLKEIDQSKIFGLILDPLALLTIRQTRMDSLGVDTTKNYAELKAVKDELDYARSLYNENPEWPILDVTHSGIEETAARVLKIVTERKGDTHKVW